MTLPFSRDSLSLIGELYLSALFQLINSKLVFKTLCFMINIFIQLLNKFLTNF